jgi:hypothetical protein
MTSEVRQRACQIRRESTRINGSLHDGLDILAIEPHLIAQTILDTEDDVGDRAISREVRDFR